MTTHREPPPDAHIHEGWCNNARVYVDSVPVRDVMDRCFKDVDDQWRAEMSAVMSLTHTPLHSKWARLCDISFNHRTSELQLLCELLDFYASRAMDTSGITRYLILELTYGRDNIRALQALEITT